MYVPSRHLVLLIADRSLQQTAANVDQIREIEERIQSLGGILTYPVGDQDSGEKARREALRMFVPFPLRNNGASFNGVLHPQEVGRNYCKAGPAFQTTWGFEVP